MASAKATGIVARAVKRGDLPDVKTLFCIDCGVPAQNYDHRDYSKPLEVDPVCRSCNQKRGKALGVHEIQPRLSLRLTTEHYDKLMKIIKQKGMTLSEWMREKIENSRTK